MSKRFEYNDGGRAKAGYKGSTGDCATRAAAIALGFDYQDVYNEINALSLYENRARRSNARTGVWKDTLSRYLDEHGWVWIPTMEFGKGCTVHLKAEELPEGRIICRLSRHFVAVIDGVINDTYDCSRDGTRCVYGYWIKNG